MKKERRWLKSVIAASLEPQIALPWQRARGRCPDTVPSAPTVMPFAAQVLAQRAA